MQLGKVLVHTRVISVGQLDEALRRQVVYGGRLGTNLIELGYADVDDVAHGLARLHHVPAALRRHLDRHDPALLERVPRELAARGVLLPVAYSLSGERKRLVLCMRDPGDRETIAEVRSAARTDVVVCVAAELVLYYWLERCYGVPRPRRHALALPGSATPLPRTTSELPVTESLDGSIDIDMDDVHDEVEMPSELRLVELDDRDVARDQSQYGFAIDGGLVSLLESADRAPGHAFEAPEPARQPPCDLADAARGAEAVESQAASLASGIAAAETRHPQPTAPEPPVADAAQAMHAITDATGRDAVADAVVAFMRGAFGGGLILLAKETLAWGYKGFGGSFDASTIESIVLPLNVPSVFQQAFANGSSFRGAPRADGGAVEARFFKLFPLPARPAEVIVVPVAIKERIVCLFYAHGRNGKALDNRAVDQLQQIATATAEAFVRLIKQAKNRSR